MRTNNNKGISMITVIITIIVIIILAAISLVGNEDAINKSAKAKKEAEIAQETQILKIALKDAENIFTGEVEKEELEEGLGEHSATIDESYVPEDPSKEEYKIVFKQTGNSYIINKNGDITVLDRIYADNEKPEDKPEEKPEEKPEDTVVAVGPGITYYPVGDKVTINGEDYFIVGEISTMEFQKNPTNPDMYLGLNLVQGDVFAYNGVFYFVEQGDWITADNRGEIDDLIAQRKVIKLNLEKGVITPGPGTEEGDIKVIDGEAYVYRPYGNDPNGWQYNWWKKMNKTPLFTFS